MKILQTLVLVLFSVGGVAQSVDLEKLKLPDRFSVSVYAELENPRQLALGADHTVFVGSLRGSVWALINSDEDGRADEVIEVAQGLNTPNGVAYHKGDLFIGEINRVSKIQNIGARLNGVQVTETVTDALPNRRHHGFKFLAIGPDEKIYLPVGAPCNVCEGEEIFGTLLKMNLDGSGTEIIARGIRNTVGFDSIQTLESSGLPIMAETCWGMMCQLVKSIDYQRKVSILAFLTYIRVTCRILGLEMVIVLRTIPRQYLNSAPMLRLLDLLFTGVTNFQIVLIIPFFGLSMGHGTDHGKAATAL